MSESPPLRGLRVLDAGTFVAAPLAAMLLGDWGAEVIKLESLEGDPCRRIGELVEPDLSATFIGVNRGKRSVTFDLGSPEGRAAAARLAQRCDVVIHNLSDQAAGRLGLDWQSLSAARADAVLCTVSAFGRSGLYAGRPALDPVIQAFAGLAAATGEPDGQPMRCAAPVIDGGAGMTAAAAVLAALHRRAEEGCGSHVGVSLLDVALTFQASLLPLASLIGGLERRGNGSFALLGDQLQTADSLIAFVVWDDRRWQALCELLDLNELAEDERYASNELRHRHQDELRPLLAEAVASRTGAELERRMLDLGIPCALTLSFEQLAADPHVTATGGIYRERRLEGPDVSMAGGAAWFDGARPRSSDPPPRLGEHTKDVVDRILGPERRSPVTARPA
jgi:crotonobetainyl-CoA:carnitine CoA-transferase CaiB-like acyl-CoA transferase